MRKQHRANTFFSPSALIKSKFPTSNVRANFLLTLLNNFSFFFASWRNYQKKEQQLKSMVPSIKNEGSSMPKCVRSSPDGNRNN